MGASLLKIVMTVVLVDKTAVFLFLIAFRVCIQPFSLEEIVLSRLLKVRVAGVYTVYLVMDLLDSIRCGGLELSEFEICQKGRVLGRLIT